MSAAARQIASSSGTRLPAFRRMAPFNSTYVHIFQLPTNRQRRFSQPLELRRKDLLRDRRGIPRQRSLGGRVIEIARDDVNMQVRDDVSQQHVVHMTRAEDALDH